MESQVRYPSPIFCLLFHFTKKFAVHKIFRFSVLHKPLHNLAQGNLSRIVKRFFRKERSVRCNYCIAKACQFSVAAFFIFKYICCCACYCAVFQSRCKRFFTPRTYSRPPAARTAAEYKRPAAHSTMRTRRSIRSLLLGLAIGSSFPERGIGAGYPPPQSFCFAA